MAKYRKKPIVIDAEQWTGCVAEMPMPPAPHYVLREKKTWRFWEYGEQWQIKTLGGWLSLSPNDWIIMGIEGEFYSCKPDIFEQIYERVE